MSSLNKVNELVFGIQVSEKDSVEYNMLYAELFEIVMRETIEPKVESFSRQLRGDISEGVSEGCELLMELVEKWEGTGNFHTLYKASLDNRLINLVHKLGRNIRSHNTSYEVSLSGTWDSTLNPGEIEPTLERINDESLVTSFDISEDEDSFEKLLKEYKDKHPTQSEVIELLLSFPNDFRKADETKAICEYYGVQTYTPAIQKRVSRARLHFKKFVESHGKEMVL